MYKKVKNIMSFCETYYSKYSPTFLGECYVSAYDTILTGGTHESLYSCTMQEKGWSNFLGGAQNR